MAVQPERLAQADTAALVAPPERVAPVERAGRVGRAAAVFATWRARAGACAAAAPA